MRTEQIILYCQSHILSYTSTHNTPAHFHHLMHTKSQIMIIWVEVYVYILSTLATLLLFFSYCKF
jgi:hypothetical protein